MNKWRGLFLTSLFITIGIGVYSFAQYGTILYKESISLFLSIIFLFWGVAEWKDREKEMASIYYCIASVNAIYFFIHILI